VRVLCTFPGKYGDILWALPAIRALSRRLGEPVDLTIAGAYGSLKPLLELQPYLGRVEAAAWWEVRDTAPMTPRVPPSSQTQEWDYDLVLHLGYRGWPQRPLPYETLDCLNAEAEPYNVCGYLQDERLELNDPWITLPAEREFSNYRHDDVTVGFSDEHFELKAGLVDLLSHWVSLGVCVSQNSRWLGEWSVADEGPGMSWVDEASLIQTGKVFVGCCSALHVLAAGLGKQMVIVEPAEARWNEIFWPLGKTGRVELLLGGDGRPTVDARHLRDAVYKKLDAAYKKLEAL